MHNYRAYINPTFTSWLSYCDFHHKLSAGRFEVILSVHRFLHDLQLLKRELDYTFWVGFFSDLEKGVLMISEILTLSTQVVVGTDLAQVADALNLRCLTRCAFEVVTNPVRNWISLIRNFAFFLHLFACNCVKELTNFQPDILLFKSLRTKSQM